MDGNRELVERFVTSLEARDWDTWAGLLHPDVVYELPQSRERIRGRDRYLRFNQDYPGDWHLRPKVMIADERHGLLAGALRTAARPRASGRALVGRRMTPRHADARSCAINWVSGREGRSMPPLWCT